MIQGQRVRRVIRRIDTWSVLRVAVLFYLSLMLVIVLAGVMLWAAGSVVGAVDGVEDFMRGIGFDGFEFVGGQLLRGFTAIGLILVVLGTGSTVLTTVLYNLIADVVGGVQLTVLEEVYVPDEDRAQVVVDPEGGTWIVPETSPAPPPPDEPADVGTPVGVGTPAAGEPAQEASGTGETRPDRVPARAEAGEAAPAPTAARLSAAVTPIAEPVPEGERWQLAGASPTSSEPEAGPGEPALVEEGADPAEEPASALATDATDAVDEERAEPAEPRPATRPGGAPSGWSTPAWQPASRSQWSQSSDPAHGS